MILNLLLATAVASSSVAASQEPAPCVGPPSLECEAFLADSFEALARSCTGMLKQDNSAIGTDAYLLEPTAPTVQTWQWVVIAGLAAFAGGLTVGVLVAH
jgi:hypothetical protein